MKKSEIIRFLILRSIGNFLVLFALFGVVMTFGPAILEEVKFRINQAQGVTYVISDPTKPTPEISQDNAPQPTPQSSLIVNAKEILMIPKDTQFSVLIPKIGANAIVIPNVDASNQQEYLDALKRGVAHARGTVFPGMQGTTYLFAHSTDNFWDVGRYNAIFYLLKDLTPQDDVTVFFGDKRYDYKVQTIEIIDPSDVNLLVNAQQTEEQLVLQTCWPPGTTWKRLLVIAKPVQQQ
jgi:sortase A